MLPSRHRRGTAAATTRPFSTRRGGRYYRNLIVFTLLVILLAVYLVLPIADAYRRLHPTRYPIGSVSPADVGLTYSDVTLTTADGTALRGWYVPPGNGAAIILVHAGNGNRTGTLHHAALLAQHGYGTLLYDASAQGESDGDFYVAGWNGPAGVLAALDFLQSRPEVDPERIGVLGLSAGAGAALRAAAESHDLAAVVAEGSGWGTYHDWLASTRPVDKILAPGVWVTYQAGQVLSGTPAPAPLLDLVPRIAPTPLLLIVAGDDRLFGRACFDAAGVGAELWDRDEPGHIDALFAHPEEYERRVVGFFDRALSAAH